MTSSGPNSLKIRSLQLRDIGAIAQLVERTWGEVQASQWQRLSHQLELYQQWYGLLRLLRLFPNPSHHQFCFYVAEQNGQVCGLIHVSPFNRTRSTWRVNCVVHDQAVMELNRGLNLADSGSQLLRHCFEKIWEARTWVLEVDINDKSTLALYRQNGFQPLAQQTYWSISPTLQAQLAELEPDLPNLLPVRNADAQLLYQLDTVSMPPLLRQVFDRHIADFKTPLWQGLGQAMQMFWRGQDRVEGYVFEPQRKAAIGHFQLTLAKTGQHPHQVHLTVHPAYTWLYPKLMAQMAQVAQAYPAQELHIISADYQQEREEYLEKLGADCRNHTLLMSRSVWHKLRETRPREGLQLPDVLGLQPARTPIPTRMSWTKFVPHQRKRRPPEAHS
ncbi:MAG: GNAT family N-acetyltransferase [Cyanobacteria bacterium P01_G01_bin.54]